MPCHSDPPTQEEIYNWDAPGAACEAIKLLDKHGLLNQLTHRTLSWWVLHRQRDAAKEEREARDAARETARKSALAKLTPEEIEALKR